MLNGVVSFLYDNIIDVRPYGLLLNSRNPGKTPDWNFHYDEKVLNEMLETFRNWEDRPMGCSMDICVTKDNRTLLVEFNDAYALGCYKISSEKTHRLACGMNCSLKIYCKKH